MAKRYRKAQDIFDTVSTHLLKQGRRSLANVERGHLAETNAYRGNNACKCAIGILLDNKSYTREMEVFSVTGLFDLFPSAMDQAQLHKRSLGLLTELQDIHDVTDPKDWQNKLHQLARRKRLSAKVLGVPKMTNTTG